MPRTVKAAPPKQTHPSSFLSLLSGWVQQGVESFFATQRVLMDVAMRQNAVAMKSLREGITDPEHSPVAILTELAVEGTSSFVEAQRILLNLAQQENELIMEGLKERVSSPPAVAMTDLIRRSIDTFVEMQQDFLKLTSKQTIAWLEAVKAGKGYNGTDVVELAREGIDNFVRAQKKFLDIVAHETTRATSGKPQPVTRTKKTEVSKLAREATNAFIEAQKKLLDVLGQQMTVNLKAATKSMELFSPTRLLPMANFTGEGVKSFVEAEKTLLDKVIKRVNGKTHLVAPRAKRPRPRRPMAHAATA